LRVNTLADEMPSILPGGADYPTAHPSQIHGLMKHVSPDEIPDTGDLLSSSSLERQFESLREPPLSLITVGDIMLGGRAKKTLAKHGSDYPFQAVLPLLRRAPLVLGNLEGPLAGKARRHARRYSYRVETHLASSLTRAGINVVTLANNHLLDCGRAGVVETLDALETAGVASLGAGRNQKEAHAPVIKTAGDLRIGLLAYYWNRRCAATADMPGSAMDPPEALESDIRRLRSQVGRVVVAFHWGIPYERDPSPEDRAKARLAVDCGADAVVGHHPHVIQPFEIYRGCPIFYSVGNFAFGSGNSHAEGLALGFRFAEIKTVVEIYPLYVKNRDSRVDYQPKVLGGEAAKRRLLDLVRISGSGAEQMRIEQWRGRLELPWSSNRPGQE
jgi:poly-gamma-glutamate capsule biosynthesis protein CapA/YwtB (metallophosphatase superfamily)